jgi:phosphatidylserine/phosphatidylglycerophosphate/cardiolipin synthase-like enzyme
MFAYAISNNDMVYLYWHVERKIPECLGFSVVRHDADTGKSQPLPAMVGFPSDKKADREFKDTDAWPVQKYAWKDLYAQRGKSYWYEIIPMLGKPGHLRRDLTGAMRTNTVSLDTNRGSCSVFFNRGIISTQAIARNLPKGRSGLPSSGALQKRIKDPEDSIRARLVGDLNRGVLTLLERAKQEGAKCYCALYELSDEELIDHLKALGKSQVDIVLSNAGEDTEEGSGDGDSTNQEAREALHDLKIDVADRMLKKGHIGHNKFVVYVDGDGPQAVLSGSTNWTATGLCAQSNNAILIESPGLAADYLKYWKALKADTDEAGDDASALQAKEFRGMNRKARPSHDLTDAENKPSGHVRVWFSPNTSQKSVPRRKKRDGSAGTPPPTPPDLKEVFELIENAKQGALFLAFIPGNPSIVSKLKEVYDAKRRAGQVFYLRGAATSPDPASVFRVNLYHRSSKSDASVRGVDNPPDAAKASATVSSVAGIFATFAQWEAELYKVGHAVIHDKIIVIDPFTDDSVVVTGSHNLGFKASYSNDENLLIIRNNRAIAEAYAAHVLDVYEHFRWRWRLQQPIRDTFKKLKEEHPDAKSADLWKQAVKEVGPRVIKEAWHTLVPKDSWQDFYEEHKEFLAAEVNFWSPFGGVSLSEGRPHAAAGSSPPRSRRGGSRS